MGEAKRRKQILGDGYGKPGTVNQTIQIAKKKNDAGLPPDFLPDFGLEVAAQIGEQPFHLIVLGMQKVKPLPDLEGKVSICFIPEVTQIARIEEGTALPIITRNTMMAVEIYNPNLSLVDAVLSALTSGVDVKANWSKRFFSQNPIYKELVVPIHLMPYEEKRLGLQHIADYI